jgi:hypothetical protein
VHVTFQSIVKECFRQKRGTKANIVNKTFQNVFVQSASDTQANTKRLALFKHLRGKVIIRSMLESGLHHLLIDNCTNSDREADWTYHPMYLYFLHELGNRIGPLVEEIELDDDDNLVSLVVTSLHLEAFVQTCVRASPSVLVMLFSDC